jgi:tungstate transport system substrate-binding protein
MLRKFVLALLAASFTVVAPTARAQDLLILGTTTTVENSGFLAFMMERFSEDTGIRVRPVIAGTGQILDAARRGDVDATFTHDPAGEMEMVRQRVLVRYQHIMRNHFLIAGPERDPANIAEAETAVDAFRRISDRRALFISRGDDSGTNRAEMRVWRELDEEELPSSRRNAWYRETGSGMGATLNVAAALNAYILVDEATWANFRNRRNLVMLARDNDRLLNIYSVAMVNPRINPNMRRGPARRFVQWMIGSAGRRTVQDYAIGGEPAFRTMSEEALAE